MPPSPTVSAKDSLRAPTSAHLSIEQTSDTARLPEDTPSSVTLPANASLDKVCVLLKEILDEFKKRPQAAGEAAITTTTTTTLLLLLLLLRQTTVSLFSAAQFSDLDHDHDDDCSTGASLDPYGPIDINEDIPMQLDPAVESPMVAGCPLPEPMARAP
ncbi:uncharacterized protein BXZ73DRAFT_110417 [Epithele typhae]|uniref:uncharacterized protein n=1 Tax=Epithele typhae TaxID=378194 RepID=UPI002007B3FF|nr:uncharacterized protein BXZ73DRAFT_110417 [Epithele typhae]KAH9907099.1 hypothetical protein BXZ73DRAFT_110417 [Epithele typhae]